MTRLDIFFNTKQQNFIQSTAAHAAYLQSKSFFLSAIVKKISPMLIIISIFLFSSCGGGGDGKHTTTASSSSQSTQMFALKQSGSIDITVGSNFTNTVTTKSSGAITYTSSDTTIATVDAQGKVIGLIPGTATITANQAADTAYSTQTASYVVNVLIAAPTELKDRRISLNVTKTTPVLAQYPSLGLITSYYTDTRFVEDGSDSGIGKFGGSYVVNDVVNNQSTQKANQLTISANNGSNIIRTVLTFNTGGTGTFVRNYLDITGQTVLLTHEGNFYFAERTFDILPKDLTNLIFTLNFKSVTSSLPATESPVTQKSFALTFLADNRVNFLSSTNSGDWNASYSFTSAGNFNITVNGVYENSGRSYKLDLTFNSFTFGTFKLNIDNGAAIASGDFNTDLKYTIEHTALKGQVIDGNTITSSFTNITYPYTVYLPPNYLTSGKTYPIIYVTDGQWSSDFNYIVDQKSKDVIMVLIGQGPDNRRMIDYTPVGALTYIKFLKQELIPYIESHYNTNNERTFFGGSVGGSLGSVLLGDEPVGTPFFKNYILDDGTFWWYTPALLQAEVDRFNKSPILSINLCLSTTKQGNITAVEEFSKRYTDRHYQGLTITIKEYPLIHENVGPPTFTDYLDILF